MKDKTNIDYVMKMPILKSVKRRFPWLVIGLLGGILASKIVSSFEETLSKNLILAGFIPLIVYMSDAVGTQMESFAIRDIAMHARLNFLKYFIKQFTITNIIAAILSFFLYFFIIIFFLNQKLALVLALSLYVSITSSVITGVVVPIFFQKEHQDPANASGPIATIIQDILSVTIYFFIASSLL